MVDFTVDMETEQLFITAAEAQKAGKDFEKYLTEKLVEEMDVMYPGGEERYRLLKEIKQYVQKQLTLYKLIKILVDL